MSKKDILFLGAAAVAIYLIFFRKKTAAELTQETTADRRYQEAKTSAQLSRAEADIDARVEGTFN